MPKDFQKIINLVNGLPIEVGSPLLVLRSETGKRTGVSLEQDQAPSYLKSVPISDALGTTPLSLFGGADVTPLKSPQISSLVIVDANPFVSRSSIIEHCTEEDCEGLFHKNLGLFVLGYSPYLYATMDNHHDLDHPFKLVNHFRMRLSEYLDEEKYRDKLSIPPNDVFYNFINENSRIELMNLWKEKDEEKDPTVKIADIGLSTIILLRIRYCLEAEILAIEELIENRFFKIKIKKPDSSEAALYYSSCVFGGSDEDKMVLDRVSTYIHDTLGGATSILIRGYPTFFGGKVKGEEAKVAHDVRSFVESSTTVPAKNLSCIVCTNNGDVLPKIFQNNAWVSRHAFPAPNHYHEQEIIYVCNGITLGLENSRMLSNSDINPPAVTATHADSSSSITQKTLLNNPFRYSEPNSVAETKKNEDTSSEHFEKCALPKNDPVKKLEIIKGLIGKNVIFYNNDNQEKKGILKWYGQTDGVFVCVENNQFRTYIYDIKSISYQVNNPKINQAEVDNPKINQAEVDNPIINQAEPLTVKLTMNVWQTPFSNTADASYDVTRIVEIEFIHSNTIARFQLQQDQHGSFSLVLESGLLNRRVPYVIKSSERNLNFMRAVEALGLNQQAPGVTYFPDADDCHNVIVAKGDAQTIQNIVNTCIEAIKTLEGQEALGDHEAFIRQLIPSITPGIDAGNHRNRL